MLKKVVAVAILAFALFIFGGCAGTKAEKSEEPKENQTEQKQAKENNVNTAQVVYDKWKDSGHATAVEADNPSEAPGLREKGGCFLCHNGYVFEIQPKDLKGIGILKGASCDTCHTGHGHDLVQKGSVTIPLGDIKGGKGALCMSCHNGRGKKPDQKSAPHYSVQTDVLLSKSGAEVKGFDYGSSPHARQSDTCLACHMAEGKDGVKDHTFKMNKENVANSCGKCHKFDNFNPPAGGDYDGDGQKEGIQDEVTGLLKVVEGAINEKLDGGKFASSGGKIQFQDKEGKALESPPSPEVYNAAWNYLLIDYDGSKGVHNPAYAVQLLQQIYKALMGKDIPKAELRK